MGRYLVPEAQGFAVYILAILPILKIMVRLNIVPPGTKKDPG